jgi:hypothetical protein
MKRRKSMAAISRGLNTPDLPPGVTLQRQPRSFGKVLCLRPSTLPCALHQLHHKMMHSKLRSIPDSRSEAGCVFGTAEHGFHGQRLQPVEPAQQLVADAGGNPGRKRAPSIEGPVPATEPQPAAPDTTCAGLRSVKGAALSDGPLSPLGAAVTARRRLRSGVSAPPAQPCRRQLLCRRRA